MQANLGHVGGKGGLEGEGLDPVVATLMRRRQPLYWPPGRSYQPQPLARLLACDATVKDGISMLAWNQTRHLKARVSHVISMLAYGQRHLSPRVS
jgi:hypothetical protein